MKPGLFRLRTATDLRVKLRHDLKRLQSNPLDEYAAFDFFVTAFHMLEWLHPKDAPRRKAMRKASTLLQICDHLASGSKHFEANDPKHQSVDDTQFHSGAFSSGFSRGFDTDRLQICLEKTAAAELAAETDHPNRQKIEVSELAERVMLYWERELS